MGTMTTRTKVSWLVSSYVALLTYSARNDDPRSLPVIRVIHAARIHGVGIFLRMRLAWTVSGMKRGLNGRWSLKGLPNHTAPLCSYAKLRQHFGRRTLLGLEMDVRCDGLEAHRDILLNAQCSAHVNSCFNLHLQSDQLDPHKIGNHPD